MRVVAAIIVTALVLISSSPAGAQSGSPEPVESSESAADTGPIEVVGPDGLGPVPSPPIGPTWQVGLERSYYNVGEMDLVACDGGFALLGFVARKRDPADKRYWPRALVWTSLDGLEWSRGGVLRPLGDPIADDWTVFDLVVFQGDLWAFGGEDRHLVVWRSRDCGQTWQRLHDRPAFSLGGKAIGLYTVRAVATADTLLVLGWQAGEWIPPRRWAWTLDDDQGWRRIRGGLDGVVDYGLVSDGRRFLANREVVVPDAISEGRLISSDDGRRWEEHGMLPDDDRSVVTDPTRDRVFVQTDVFDTGWTSAELQASTDDETWTPLVRAAPTTQNSGSQLFEADGALVWIIDIWDDTDTNAWSWIAVSEDGGATWTVSAGQPGMQLAGLQSVAATDDAVVLAFTGEGFDEIHAWALPRADASAVPGAIKGTWLPMARSPFGSQYAAAAWTGDALIVVDPKTARTASYDPVEDSWAELDAAPAPFSPSDASTWTGTELLVFPDRLAGDPMALDPTTGTWRTLSPMPSDIYFDPEFAVWTGDEVVLAGGSPPQAAIYDSDADAWASLSRPDGRWVIGLTWTGSQVLAETQGPTDDEPIIVWRLDRAAGEWTQAAPGPVSPAVGPGLWVDGVLAYLRTDDEIAGPESDAAYDPASDAWRPLRPACGVYTIEAVAAGSIIVLGTGRAAMGVATGDCGRLEQPTSGIYGGGARVWTGDEVLFWSGIASLDGPPRRTGVRLAMDEAASRE